MMEFGSKIAFSLWYIYYLAVSTGEYCALSAFVEKVQRAVLLCSIAPFAPCHGWETNVWKSLR